MRAFVTGGAGFIASHLTDRLLAQGHAVTVFDNFSTGRHDFLDAARSHRAFSLVEGDLLNLSSLVSAIQQHDVVFHFAANADVRFGLERPRRDLEQNTIATHNVLEAMRLTGVPRIAFSSTGSIYCEPRVFPTPEECPFPVQTSLYGASKLAAEGLIGAYVTGFGIQGTIFRFVSILGERYTHGHVVDFFRKLTANPDEIEVLGDGQQRKSYLYIHDCIDAIFTVLDAETAPVAVFNLGTDEHCTVDESLGWICEAMGVNPERRYSGGERGWVGDSPFIYLDTSRIRSLGWLPKLTIREGVLRTLSYLREHPELLPSA
jgi:UDP-glucose 4-epimerase